MMTAIFLTLALVFAAGLIIAALRRTLPLTIAAGLGWLAFAASGETGVGVVAALAALFMAAYALDELALAERWRPALIAAEAVAGMSLVTLIAFAVFYSAGVRGSGLYIALAASAFVALGATLRFRRGVRPGKEPLDEFA